MHDGHRQRLKRRFLKEGINNFEKHNVLELLLFYAIPQRDTNPIAHELINKFGSISAVFNASVGELIKIPYITENVAVLIKLIPSLSRVYMDDSENYSDDLSTLKNIGKFLMPKFIGYLNEMVYIICLDFKHKIINSEILFNGGLSEVNVDMRKFIQTIVASNAAYVIIAHNHPGGIALPSKNDIATTELLMRNAKLVNAELQDHIIIADNDYISMRESGFINSIDL